jgi:hypothetical protein
VKHIGSIPLDLNYALKAQMYAKRLLIVTFLVLPMIQMVAVGLSSAAGSSTLSYSPTTTTLEQGANTTIALKIIAGSSKITAAQACVKFDTSQLSLVNINYTGTPLGSTTPSDNGSDCATGEVQLGRYTLGSRPTGTFDLAVLTFKGLSSGGSASLSFGMKSFVYDDSNSSTPPGVLDIDSSKGIEIALTTSTTSVETSRNLPAITDSGRPVSEGGLATSSDIQMALDKASTTQQEKAEEKTTSSRRTYIIMATVVVVLLLASTVLIRTDVLGIQSRKSHRVAQNHKSGDSTPGHEKSEINSKED